MFRRALMLAIVATALAVPEARASGGGACYEPITSADSNEVVINAFCYQDTVVHVSEGETVTFSNEDFAPHTVTGANNIWGDYVKIRPRRSRAFRFEQAGVYPYYCALHPGMTGAVVVGDVQAAAGSKIQSGAVDPVRPGRLGDDLEQTSAETPPQSEPTSTGAVFTSLLVAAFCASGILARRAAKRRARIVSRPG